MSGEPNRRELEEDEVAVVAVVVAVVVVAVVVELEVEGEGERYLEGTCFDLGRLALCFSGAERRGVGVAGVADDAWVEGGLRMLSEMEVTIRE